MNSEQPREAELIWDVGCALGEGPIWAHGRLWFFDITGKKLHSCDGDGQERESRDLPFMASAAAPAPEGSLLIATEREIARFDTQSGAIEILADLEADNAATRSNDGRADRHGAFWIGTMGKDAAPEAGALYRFDRKRVTCLREKVSIPNAICFSPDGRVAHFADTNRKTIWRWNLDEDGMPEGDPEVFIDFTSQNLRPDGAVIDSEGAMWVAFYGGSRAIRFLPDGTAVDEVRFPVPNVTCPAFGGDLNTLYFTTARQGLDAEKLEAFPLSGGLFRTDISVPGLPEPEVRVR